MSSFLWTVHLKYNIEKMDSKIIHYSNGIIHKMFWYIQRNLLNLSYCALCSYKIWMSSHHSSEVVLELTLTGCLLYSIHYSVCISVNFCNIPMKQTSLTTLFIVQEMRHRENNQTVSRSHNRLGFESKWVRASYATWHLSFKTAIAVRWTFPVNSQQIYAPKVA